MGEQEPEFTEPHDRSTRPNFLKRRALRGLAKQARKPVGAPLSADDWEAYWRFVAQPDSRAFRRAMRALPSTPRCDHCGVPFAGAGGLVMRRFGFEPSRKNPHVCSNCVELTPPGGITIEIGVLFADLRNFTTESETRSPAEVGEILRKYYSHAEKVFFPEAMIDKLIGDEIMALYVPWVMCPGTVEPDDALRRRIAETLVAHARTLFERIGEGTARAPEFKIGIGADYGEAFVGNIGEGAVYDFTAVGDVVNTASRLQGHAAAGELVISDRLARHLPASVGKSESLTVKGKQEPIQVHRVRWFGDTDRGADEV